MINVAVAFSLEYKCHGFFFFLCSADITMSPYLTISTYQWMNFHIQRKKLHAVLLTMRCQRMFKHESPWLARLGDHSLRVLTLSKVFIYHILIFIHVVV